ncbi:MAG: hypothetical protein O3B74_08535 [Proteobacteria bacterium]|nr:hypothetical protein [Pseudomonadota bacterium]
MAKTSGSFGQGRHRHCAARSKRTRVQCQAPAMTGKRVCYHHGGRSPGAAPNEAHWNFRHGNHSAEAREVRRLGRWSLKRLRAIGAINPDGEIVPPGQRPPEPPMSLADAEELLRVETTNAHSAARIRARRFGRADKW